MLAGGVYKPDAEMEPTWGEIDQVTEVLAEPVTVDENCWGDDEAVMLTLAGEAEIVTTGRSVTVAVAVLVASAALVAVTVMAC